MCIDISPSCVFMHHVWALSIFIRSPRNAITDNRWWATTWVLRTGLGSLDEQPVLLITESSLQSPNKYYKMNFMSPSYLRSHRTKVCHTLFHTKGQDPCMFSDHYFQVPVTGWEVFGHKGNIAPSGGAVGKADKVEGGTLENRYGSHISSPF